MYVPTVTCFRRAFRGVRTDLLLLFLVVVAGSLFGAETSGTTQPVGSVAQRIEESYRKAQWDEIVQSMKGFVWRDQSDLGALMRLAAATVETRGGIGSHLDRFHVPSEIKEFLLVYEGMIAGSLRPARDRFDAMARDSTTQELGLFGLLEYAVHVGNARLLDDALKRARGSRPSRFLLDRLPPYEITLAELQGDDKRIERLISFHRLDRIEYSLPQIGRLLDQGKFKEARKSIGVHRAKFGFGHDIAFLESELVLLEQGLEKFLAYLDRRTVEHPRYWRLKQQKFYGLMKQGRAPEATAIFAELLRDHPNKPSVAADRILYFGEELARAGSLEGILFREGENFSDVPVYQLAVARILHSELGQEQAAMQLVEKVALDAPHLAEVLLTRAQFARAAGNTKNEIKHLEAYVTRRPQDSRILRALIDLHQSLGNFSEAKKYQRRLASITSAR